MKHCFSNISRIAAVVTFVLISWVAQASAPIGKVVEIQGKVVATGTDGQARVLELKSDVFLNDKIASEKQSRIQIVFDDDSMISQGETSEMIIDQYVYTPKKKDDANCSIKMTKGFFRVVTGKITTLNPDRLKVQTRMATIGVRGCEVGFAVDEEREDIYILWLPYGKSILVSKNEEPGSLPSGVESYRRVMNILDEGVAVSIRAGSGLEERPIGAQEARDFYSQFAGAMSDGTGGDGTEDVTPPDSGANDRDLARQKITDNIQNSVDTLQQEIEDASNDSSQETTGDQIREPPSRPASRPAASEKPPADQVIPDPPPTDGGPSTEPPSTQPPGELPPLPPAISASGSGSDWLWGIYDDGSLPDHYGLSISDANYQQIVTGATYYDLSGSGAAGANISYSPDGRTIVNRVVDGPCQMTVRVGNSVSPSWSGSFNLSRDGNSLVFNASGQIVSGGQLQGTWSGYSLLVDDRSLTASSLNTGASSINGQIVGPGTGATPITGIEGTGKFIHSDPMATRADVVFGADVSAN